MPSGVQVHHVLECDNWYQIREYPLVVTKAVSMGVAFQIYKQISHSKRHNQKYLCIFS